MRPNTDHPLMQQHSATAPSTGPALSDCERVLLLGEGNFSFAAALALEWGQCANLTATTPMSETSTVASDHEAEDNLETVKAFGGCCAFRVDATALTESAMVVNRAKKGFDKIAFNFPALDSPDSSSSSSIEAHQSLLRGMFKSVLSGRLLRETTGEILITAHTTAAARWKLVEIASIAGLRLKACTDFDPDKYHGYVPSGGAAKTAKTYSFVEPPTKLTVEEKKAKAVAMLRKAHPELRIGPTGQTYKEAWKQRHGKHKS